MAREPKSTEAARKKIDAGNSRLIAKQYAELDDSSSESFYEIEATRLDAEAAKLLKPDHPIVVGTGGEVALADPDSCVRDLLIENPTTTSLDASSHRLDLLERLDCVAPALDAAESIQARNSFEKELAHQMAVAHTTAMSLLAEASETRRSSSSYNAEILALKKQHMARMFMDYHVRALEALMRVRSGGRQNITVTHKTVNVTSDQAIIAEQVISDRGQGRGPR